MSITNERNDPDFLLDLSGIKIPPDLSFSDLKFSSASFEHAEFVGNVKFCKTEFLDILHSRMLISLALQISMVLFSMIVVTLNIPFFTVLLCS